MKLLSLSIALLALALGSCERHSWEDKTDENGKVIEKGTKRLYQEHEDHGGGHSDQKEGDSKDH